MKPRYTCLTALALLVSTLAASAQDAAPFIGRWALTIPSGRAGWLEITKTDQGYLDGRLLWGGGSVLPVDSVYVIGDTLHVIRLDTVERKDGDGNVIRTHHYPETITGRLDGEDGLELVHEKVRTDGIGAAREDFAGQRIPELPPAPDLSAVSFGKPVVLFNGLDLEGWSLVNPGDKNGWRADDGLLINEPVQKEGEPRIHYGNLRTDAEFEDFNLTLDVKVPEAGNSGVYLRGVYEVQVLDSHGKPPHVQHMGAVYSRIAPSTAAEKPAGEWQKLDVSLVDRHITVKLNGTLIIDNKPLLGCTGGALWSDEFRPGPIMLQGDHTGVQYRDIVLRPVVEKDNS